MKKNNRRSIPAPPTNIYDQFLIVGLKEETLTPVVLYTYPSQNPAAPNVALFCFPEDICPETVNRIKTGASFFFVLTDEVGRQQVGFTRRIGRGKDMRCLCMLTHRDSSWMYTFGSILEECEGRYKAKGPNQLEPFLASLYSTPVPEPGMEIAKFGGANNNQSGYNFGNNYNTNNNTNNTNNNNNLLLHLYSRPIPCPDTTDTALVGVNMIPLLANLTTNSILQLFASLLFERRTILVSSQLERVSASAQASLSALFPFAWHHIFIPILPLSLVDYCSAPMPFVIGLHSSLMLSIIKMPLSEVVYVDLDRDQVSPVEGDMQLLPSALLTPLKSVLDAATSEFHNLQSSASKSNFDWQRVSDAFRQFFVRVFAGYGKFFVNKPGYGVSFDKEGFIASQNKNIRKFLEAFCASQMFERFIAEREAGKQNSIFENEIKLQEAAQAHVGIGSALQDKAKKSVERLTTFGAAVRNHLQENPFGGLRNTQDPSRPSTASSSSSLHPSLVRGQVVHASSNPPQRRAKPLPPIPPGATPSSAFPPHDISANVPPSGSPWDAFNDNTGTLNPVERPKSATVTSISPSSHNMPINPIPVPVSLPHSNSTNSIPHPSSSLPPNTNVFDFSPFDNMDTTPATPAPSISNTRAPDWFSPELVAGKLAAVSSNDSLNPFLTPSSPKLPPISMKPLNPFVENQIPHDAGHQNEEREGHNNLFTSFSLDALAPPDLANVHSPSLTTSYHGSGGYFEPTPTATYGSPSSNSGAYMPKQGGTMPNYNNSPAAGGTMPNYGHVVESTPNPPGGFAHGTSPQFESFLAARMIPVRSSSTNDVTGGAYHQQQILQQQLHHQQVQQQYLQHQHQQHQHHQQQQQQQHPDEGDDFDSFLAARIKQM